MLACRLTLRSSHLPSQVRCPASGAVRTFFTIIKGAPPARRAVPALADSAHDRDALREFVRWREVRL